MSSYSKIQTADGSVYYFGKYPDQKLCNKLKERGVKVFLSLVERHETDKNGDYIQETCFRHYKSCFLNFPIIEKSIPKESEREEILDLLAYMKKKSPGPFYIHCKHGRGRTCLILALILTVNHDMKYEKALKYIYKAHRKGHGKNPIWEGKVLPPHKHQREYVKNFLEW